MKVIYIFLLTISFSYASEWIHTYHCLNLKEQTIHYKATTGKLALKNEKGETKGKIFFTAYTSGDEERPITFIFNGGPGSSSAWLHLGAFGPKRILLEEEGQTITPPYQLVDNEETLLDVSDLVFIDPMGTGFSSCEEEMEGYFYSIDGDVDSLATFMRDFLTQTGRWNSPKYIIGESYGTTRTASLAATLQSSHGIFLNGICLISSALDFKNFVFSEDNHLPYALFLPSYTATAWHHNKLGISFESFDEAIEYSKKFAMNTYLPALMKGSAISEAEKLEIAEKLCDLTGISQNKYLKHDLKVSDHDYFHYLLEHQRKRIGRMDSRETGWLNYHSPQDHMFSLHSDPSFKISSIFTCLMNQYLKDVLNYEEEYLPYRVFNNHVHASWSFYPNSWTSANVMPSLRYALLINQDMKVFVANGYFDLATPFFNNEYVCNQISLPNTNITQKNYIGGHMMYLDLNTRKDMKKDLMRFFDCSKENLQL